MVGRLCASAFFGTWVTLDDPIDDRLIFSRLLAIREYDNDLLRFSFLPVIQGLTPEPRSIILNDMTR